MRNSRHWGRGLIRIETADHHGLAPKTKWVTIATIEHPRKQVVHPPAPLFSLRTKVSCELHSRQEPPAGLGLVGNASLAGPRADALPCPAHLPAWVVGRREE